MQAAALLGFGDADRFELRELPDVPVGPGDVAITVTAAAVNPVDIATRTGALGDLPFPLVGGWDVAGVVSEVGEGVISPALGTPVIAAIAAHVRPQGTYATRVVAPAWVFAPAPRRLDLADAAALPLAGLTAHQSIEELDLAPSSRVLVTGAAGAVGRIAVQLLRHAGHEVGAVARQSDADDLAALGVSATTNLEDAEPRAWDAVYDTAGLPAAIGLVRDGGTFVSIVPPGASAGERGITPHLSFVNESGERLARLVELVDAGVLTVPVGRRLPLADVAEAHRALEAGGTRGKILLLP